MTDKLTQQAILVLDYLKARADRKLTSLAAHTFLGVASITARIAELRAAGHEIEDAWQTDKFKRRYKEYWLKVQPDAKG